MGFNINDSDLNDGNSQKLLGADGVTEAIVRQDGSLKSTDILGSSGLQSNLVLITTNESYEVKVGSSRLVNRKMITIMPMDNDIYWGYNSSVTVNTGTKLFKNQVLSISASDQTQIWVVTDGNNKNVRITEST